MDKKCIFFAAIITAVLILLSVLIIVLLVPVIWNTPPRPADIIVNVEMPGETGTPGHVETPGETDTPGVSDTPTLQTSDNLQVYAVSDTARIVKDTWEQRYHLSLSASLTSTIRNLIESEHYTLCFLVAPVTDFEKAEVPGVTFDYITAFEKAGASFEIIYPQTKLFEPNPTKGTYIITDGVYVDYESLNVPMFFIPYLESADGTRIYGTLPGGETPQSLGRSWTWGTVNYYNEQKAQGTHDYYIPDVTLAARQYAGLAEDDIENFKGFIPYIVKENHLYDNLSLVLNEGGEYQYQISVHIKDTNFFDLNLPWLSVSSDTAVAVVENGTIKAVGTGTCTIINICGYYETTIHVTVQ